ncbi:MAG: 30S ribosomal protein S9 [Planctomycetota bacterium]
MAELEVYCGTGRRKTAIARVRLSSGNGKIKVNSKNYTDYFTRDQEKNTVTAPLRVTKTQSKYDVFARLNGGGTTGQASALCLGIARALAKADTTLTDKLRETGLFTRDGREKERKKYGQRGARARFQFSKR